MEPEDEHPFITSVHEWLTQNGEDADIDAASAKGRFQLMMTQCIAALQNPSAEGTRAALEELVSTAVELGRNTGRLNTITQIRELLTDEFQRQIDEMKKRRNGDSASES